jgi:hypothetical protein
MTEVSIHKEDHAERHGLGQPDEAHIDASQISGGNVPGIVLTGEIFVSTNGDDILGDGSIGKPYLTIGKATLVATVGQVIMLSPGTYAEDVTLPANVSLRGSGTSGTTIDGDFSTTVGSQVHIYGVLITGAVTLNTSASLIDCYFTGAVLITGACIVQTWNTHFIPSSTGVTAITMDTTGGARIVLASITSSGNVPTIDHYAGSLILELCEVTGDCVGLMPPFPPMWVIHSFTAGAVDLFNTAVINLGGTLASAAVRLDNGATTTPNALNGVMAVGSIDCGGAVTVAEAVVMASGSLTGTALLFRPASRVANDSTITGATVKDALDTIDARLIAGGL